MTWDNDVRYELINGVPFAMAPPSIARQRISGKLCLQLAINQRFLKETLLSFSCSRRRQAECRYIRRYGGGIMFTLNHGMRHAPYHD